jgi:WD40 repeat protein
VREETAGPDVAWRELQAVLDEELARLPRKYREPFVLCCLEGRGRKEAASELGWKEGTVSSRIAQARRLLQARLARRGVALSAALTAGELWRQSAYAALPLGLGRRAVAVALGKAVPVAVAALASGTAARTFTAALALLAGLSIATVFAVGVPSPSKPDDKDAEPGLAETKPAPAADAHGDPLPPDAVARLGTLRFRPGGHLSSLAFTPDGKQIVSFGHWAGVHVWDAATGREVARLPYTREAWIAGALLSKDGKAVFTREPGKGGTVVRRRRLPDFRVLQEFPVGNLQTMGLSPDGTRLVGHVQNHSTDYSMEVWDVEGGKRLLSWKAHAGGVRCHAFTADGKRLVTGGDDRAVRFWDVDTGAKTREIAHPGIVGLLAQTGDGATLATVGMDEKDHGGGMKTFSWNNRIRLWDVPSRKETRQLDMPAGFVAADYPAGFTALRFAPDGKTLVSGGHDGLLRFWDVTAGKQLRQFPLGTKGLYAFDFSPDGKALALGTNAIRLIDVATGKDVVQLEGHRMGLQAAVPLGDGRTVATAGDGAVLLWDLRTGRSRRVVEHANMLATLRLLPDGRTLLGMDGDNTLLLWDAATGRELRRLQPEKTAPGLLAVAPDGRTAALPGADGAAVLIDLPSGKEVGRLKGSDERCYGAAFSPDGRTLTVCGSEHTATVWDLKSRRQVRQFEFAEAAEAGVRPKPRPVPVGGGGRRGGLSYGAAPSPDGRLIAYGSQEGYLALHEAASGKLLRAVPTGADGACFFAFTPDNRMLAWVGWNEPAIHLLEVATGKERLKLDGHKGRVHSLAFSADGRTLVSGSADTTALVWGLVGRDEAKDFDACWADLTDADAAKAFRAMRWLLRSPAEAVAALRKRLAPVPAVDEKRLARLIADLDSDAFAERERATAELEKLGDAAAGAFREATPAAASPEKRRRLERLLKPLDAQAADPSPERLRLARSLEVLERADTAEARGLLKALAGGADGAWLTQQAKEALARRPAR